MKLILILGLVTLLAACGGGGSAEEPSAGMQPVQCGASGVCR